MGELEKLWDQRFDIEHGEFPERSDFQPVTDRPLTKEQRITDVIDKELRLLFGIALFSHLDQKPSFYHSLVEKTFTCDRPAPEAWLESPLNLVLYFSEERVAWALSMILLLSHHQFSRQNVAEDFKKRFAAKVKSYSDAFRDLESRSIASLEDKNQLALGQFSNKIRSNLDQLLTELGAHTVQANDEVVRFLQSRLIYVKLNHNPTRSTLERLIRNMDARFRKEAVREASNGSLSAPPNVVSFGPDLSDERRQLQALSKDALYAVGQLQMVAEVIPRLFVFTAVMGEEVKPFRTADPKQDGLAQTIRELGELLQKLRQRNQFSEKQFGDLRRLWNQTNRLLFERGSPLRKILLQYIVCLDEALEAASTAPRRRCGGGQRRSRPEATATRRHTCSGTC